MILNHLGSAIKRQDWFVVLIEIFIVVIGIYIGLQVDAWNEARKDREKELIILDQLKAGLEVDLANLEEAMDRFKNVDERVGYLIEHIKAKKPYAPELDADFGALYGIDTQSLNRAAYESLKSEGLDLVSNPALRSQITQVFEKTYANLDLSYEDEKSSVLGVLRPYFLFHFKDLRFNVSATPLDYEALSGDQEFLNIADYRLQVVRQNHLVVFGRSITEIRALLGSLATELGTPAESL